MAHPTDETIEVVPTPKRNATMTHKFGKPGRRMTYNQLKHLLQPAITAKFAKARKHAGVHGHKTMTERFDIQSFRSTEVNDVVHILKEALANEFGESYEIFTIYHDTNQTIPSSDFRLSNAERDLTFFVSPL